MSVKRYNFLLKTKEWYTKRNSILKKQGYKCQRCNTKSNLNVHHLKYHGNPWDVNDEDLIVLCKRCHILAHLKFNSHNIFYKRLIQLIRKIKSLLKF